MHLLVDFGTTTIFSLFEVWVLSSFKVSPYPSGTQTAPQNGYQGRSRSPPQHSSAAEPARSTDLERDRWMALQIAAVGFRSHLAHPWFRQAYDCHGSSALGRSASALAKLLLPKHYRHLQYVKMQPNRSTLRHAGMEAVRWTKLDGQACSYRRDSQLREVGLAWYGTGCHTTMK